MFFFLLSFFYKNRATFKYPNTRRYIATHRPESRVRQIHSKKNHFGSIPILNTEIEIEIFFGPMSGEKSIEDKNACADVSTATSWVADCLARRDAAAQPGPFPSLLVDHDTPYTHTRTDSHTRQVPSVCVCVCEWRKHLLNQKTTRMEAIPGYVYEGVHPY